MKKILFTAIVALLTIAAVSANKYQDDKKNQTKECSAKCDDKCKKECGDKCKDGKCTKGDSCKSGDMKKDCCKKKQS